VIEWSLSSNRGLKRLSAFETDTYTVASREEGALFLSPRLKAGERRDIYGKVLSTLKAGSWQMAFEVDNNPIPEMGQPRDFFSGGVAMVKGSAEETAFREQQRVNREQAAHAAADAAQREMARLQAALEIPKGEWAGESKSSKGRQESWPMQVRLLFDQATRKVSGEVEWPTLNSVNRIEGDVVGGKLVFTETAFIRKGQAVLGCVYTLTAPSEISLSGQFECGSADSGATTLVRR